MNARKTEFLEKIALSLQPQVPNVFTGFLTMLQNTAAVNFSIFSATHLVPFQSFGPRVNILRIARK